MDPNADPLKCFARPLRQPPSVPACMRFFLPSVLSTVREKHSQFGSDQATDLAIEIYLISLH